VVVSGRSETTVLTCLRYASLCARESESGQFRVQDRV